MQETTFNGLAAIHLERDNLRLTMIPAWGGKIASIYDAAREREWMHVNPHFDYRLPTYDADYVADYDVGGFDECFPNIGAGDYPEPPWTGTALPDHGEVWALPWRVEPVRHGVRLNVHGVRLPYHLEKTVTMRGDGRFRIDYRVKNPTPFAMSAVWSSHPIFEVRPGMSLEVPCRRMRVDGGVNFPAVAGDIISWPDHAGMTMERLPEPEAGWAAKLFTVGLEEGWVRLADAASNASFRFEFDANLVTHVGLWLNYGGWAGAAGAPPYYNIAIEPCIGVADRLDVALAEGACLDVPANGMREWWLEVVMT